MLSTITEKIYYIGTKVKDLKTNKVGIVYKINVLGSNGIRVKFDDNTKKAYFGIQLCDLEIVNN